MLNQAIHHLDAWIGCSAGTIDNIAIFNIEMAAAIVEYQAVAWLGFKMMLGILPDERWKLVARMRVAVP